MKEQNINEFVHRTFTYYTDPIGSNAEFTNVNMHGLSFTSTKMANKTLNSGYDKPHSFSYGGNTCLSMWL